MNMDRTLETEIVEGELSLVIDYTPGKTVAVDVLQTAMRLIQSLDALDNVLLSSVNTSLEPVSILNDVQHSSLKMLLARALRGVPDEHLTSLEWKRWVGGILVKGKHLLLQRLDADGPEVLEALQQLEPDYRAAPVGLIGYTVPAVSDVQQALDDVSKARSLLPGQTITVQSELGDVILHEAEDTPRGDEVVGPVTVVTNRGIEFFKIKSVDMLGASQWAIIRNNRVVKVDMLHLSWLQAYHERKYTLLPGDSLECKFEEAISYDASHTELERRLSVVEVLRVISPPVQQRLM
jgi:hypothetical protein